MGHNKSGASLHFGIGTIGKLILSTHDEYHQIKYAIGIGASYIQLNVP